MPAAPTLAIDLTRLLAGAMRNTPRGIDRVELHYAQHFLLDWRGDCFSVLSTPWGLRAFTRDEAARGVDAICAYWGEDAVERSRIGRHIAATLRAPRSVGRSPLRLPAGALYLNVGHISLARAGTTAWLRRRGDIRPAFMLHDLIPLQHPRYFAPAELRYFRRILDSLPLARGLIFNSRSVAAAFAAEGEAGPPRTLVQPLPVEPAFLHAAKGSAPQEPAYCVVCGEIESRKNHRLLADAWRNLAQDGGRPFRLVIVGGRGDAAQGLFARIRRWDPQKRHVEARHGLTTVQLRELLKGATALLAPSRAEGFDLPVIEALALGVPVLASDIPVHRETAGLHADYVAPFDDDAWLAAIRRLRDDPAEVARLQALAKGYRPLTPAAYFKTVSAFLQQLARED